jgi:hypothetical protein
MPIIGKIMARVTKRTRIVGSSDSKKHRTGDEI